MNPSMVKASSLAIVAILLRRAYNISHLKDSEAQPGKVFRIAVKRTFDIAKASGYRGYFSVELEGEGDPYVETTKLIELGLKCQA